MDAKWPREKCCGLIIFKGCMCTFVHGPRDIFLNETCHVNTILEDHNGNKSIDIFRCYPR